MRTFAMCSESGDVLTDVLKTFLSVGDDIIIITTVVNINDDGYSKGRLFSHINIIIIIVITSSLYKPSTLIRESIIIYFFLCNKSTLISIIISRENCKFTYF